MHAADGDRIIVASATLCAPAKDGEILEVHGSNGEAVPGPLVRYQAREPVLRITCHELAHRSLPVRG
jgi:hypothetical protein